jgi:hypothetical protein
MKCIAVGALLCALWGIPAAAERDAKSEAVAHQMMKSMGGESAWNDARYVRFDFIVTMGGAERVNRSHLWDKYTGRYRLEQQTEKGRRVVLFNANDKSGTVYLDGKQMSGTDADKQLESAYGAFINDMYWLAMPWKWMDPGVNLKHLGTRQHEGKPCDVVELTFRQVGLTPGDTYHAYVDQSSHLMVYWEYTLQSGNKGAWEWEYGDFGGLKLASNHTNAEGASINMGKVAVTSSIDETFFTDPGKSLSH